MTNTRSSSLWTPSETHGVGELVLFRRRGKKAVHAGRLYGEVFERTDKLGLLIEVAIGKVVCSSGESVSYNVDRGDQVLAIIARQTPRGVWRWCDKHMRESYAGTFG